MAGVEKWMMAGDLRLPGARCWLRKSAGVRELEGDKKIRIVPVGLAVSRTDRVEESLHPCAA